MKNPPENPQSGRHHGYMRTGFAIVGLLWFIWIGIEDAGPGTVLFMAAAALLVFGAAAYRRLSSRLPRSGALHFASIMFFGLLVGLLVTPSAVLLMAVKTSLHNHVIPDFTPTDVLQVLASTPAWSLGGLLLSTAAAILDHLSTG